MTHTHHEEITLALSDIKPYKNNPRINDMAVEPLANSMRLSGYDQYILVDEDNIILKGHTRLKALTYLNDRHELGKDKLSEVTADKVKVIKVYGLTEKEKKASRIADNKVGELAQWDHELLSIEMEDIGIDMGELGFDDTILTDEQTEIVEDDYEEPEQLPPKVKRGQIWKLGDHVLMCGDATTESDFDKLLNVHNKKADMVFTDPPYNVSLGTKNRTLNTVSTCERIERPILNDGDDGQTDEEVGRSLWLPAFTNLKRIAEDVCSLYVTMPQGGTHMMMMMMMIHKSGWQVKHELMWYKNAPAFSMNRLDYDYQHEPILYGWNKTHKFIGKGQFNKSVWPIDRLQRCDLHPTMKPIALISNAILNSSDEGDTIADAFGGSGSTLIACEETNRHCIMMELDEHYCDVIIDRWEKHTGKTAELIEG